MQQVGDIVQSRGKIKELAESLEMDVEEYGDHPTIGYELLKAWSDEMQQLGPNLRSHLSYHLNTVGISDIAKR